MNARTLSMVTVATFVVLAGNSMAHPGGGVGAGFGVGGPPPSVTMGPPAAALAHIPSGVPFHQPVVPQAAAVRGNASIGADVGGDISDAVEHDPSLANAAAELGKLNAAHASSTALEHASPNSIVGAIATYKSATIAAQAAVGKYTTLVSQDQATISTDQAALASAQGTLTTLQSSGTATPDQLASAQAAVSDAQTALAAANTQLAADQASLSAAQASIVSAQDTLASAANKPLTPGVIAQLNAMLGI